MSFPVVLKLLSNDFQLTMASKSRGCLEFFCQGREEAAAGESCCTPGYLAALPRASDAAAEREGPQIPGMLSHRQMIPQGMHKGQAAPTGSDLAVLILLVRSAGEKSTLKANFGDSTAGSARSALHRPILCRIPGNKVREALGEQSWGWCWSLGLSPAKNLLVLRGIRRCWTGQLLNHFTLWENPPPPPPHLSPCFRPLNPNQNSLSALSPSPWNPLNIPVPSHCSSAPRSIFFPL